MKPKITLALFNYNQAKYLPDSLGAISAQSDPPDEILLFDDASSDNSLELLRKVPGAKFYFNEKNLGLFANIDKALETAENDFIVLTAADDILHPEFIEEHRKLIGQHPEIGLTCSDCVFFEDKKPVKYEIYNFLPLQNSKIFGPEETVSYFRKSGFTLLSFTCVYKRSLLKKYGGYDTSLKSLADFYLNTQIALRHPIGYIPRPLAAARIVPNSYGEKFRKNHSEKKKIYDRLFQLVCVVESPEFRRSFLKARLLCFGGLSTLYYMVSNPKYWRLLPSHLFKNWKLNLKKIFCLMFGISIPRIPVKAIHRKWP